MGIYYLKAFDTQPVLDVFLKKPDGTAYDPTGSTVRLNVRTVQGLFERTMTIVDGPTGQVRYTGSDLDWVNAGFVVLTPGAWPMEYEVTTSGGVLITFPNSGYDHLMVTADLDSSPSTPPTLDTGAVLLESGSNTKISALTDGAPALSTDQLVVARSGANRRVTVADLSPLYLKRLTRQFTIAEVKALGTVPLQVLAAQAGILFVPFLWQFIKDTTAVFAGTGSNIRLRWESSPIVALGSVADAFLATATVSGRHQSLGTLAMLIGEAVTETGGKAIFIERQSGTDLTGTGSTCTMKLYYYELPSAA